VLTQSQTLIALVNTNRFPNGSAIVMSWLPHGSRGRRDQPQDVSEQTAASDETAKSSVELARLGNQLQMMVSHFRV